MAFLLMVAVAFGFATIGWLFHFAAGGRRHF